MNDGPTVSVLDGGRRSCVVLLMELRRHVSALNPGDAVHLIAHDPAAPLDLAAWCHLTGHTYLGPVPSDQPTYAIRVEAGALSTEAHAPWRRRRPPT
ncbi:sulfurtransferase TusA family protein [Nonomuraea sp. NPDC059194]|uniref:sulfurtransferase TusA family protein n=1 Tax=Nonomuraea sp. NPDC059194 TaxID=3346764 RepID=UPI0036985E2B